MDNYKFAIIFGRDNEKNNTKDGQALYYGDNTSGEMHIKSFLDFIEKYYKDDEMLSKINIRHQATMPAYLLEEQGNIVFLNTTSLEEKELEKYGRNGIVFLPKEITDNQFETLLKMILPYSKSVEEYTVEANPESLTLSKIKLMKKYGVNRLSIGVESTDDKILKSINRKHTFADVQKAVELARNNGIDNINLDLIIGLPNVSKKMLDKDIINILSLKPNHISCYSLTVHEHTVFYINEIEEPIEQFAYDAYKHIDDVLNKAGYEHYEVSNWARPGKESKHNLTYWNNERYYGVGLAASGYLENIRYKNTINFSKYVSFKNEIEQEIVTDKDQIEYEVMLRLRTKYGLDISKLNLNKDAIKEYVDGGYLTLNGNQLVATFEGMMILDKIVLDLLL